MSFLGLHRNPPRPHPAQHPDSVAILLFPKTCFLLRAAVCSGLSASYNFSASLDRLVYSTNARLNLARMFRLIHYNSLPKGGHFAAWEQPTFYSEELRA